jgi:small-conductance mechanosensitive channel
MNGFEFDLRLLGPLVNTLVAELSTAHGWWAAVAVVACLGVALVVSNAIEGKLAARGKGVFAISWARRVAWPLLALLLMLVARAVLQRFAPVSVLSVAIALMLSMAIIRTAVLVLRQTFRQAQWMGTFERTIATLIWILVALHVLGLLPAVVETLESISIPLGKTQLTMLQLLTGLITVAVATVVALWVGKALDSRLAATQGIDVGARTVIGRVAKPLLLVVALMVALPMVGIDLTTLSVFGGALGVGLGLGLQRIAANYVSGFIILLDKSIEPGRMIRVATWRGTVAEIRTRYTVLRGMDGVDSIVPNEMLVGSVVESETFSNTTTRVAVQVGVAYASDVERAMALIEEAAAEQPRVLKEPPPRAFLVAFADSSINLEVGFWIDDPKNGTLLLRSDVNRAILRKFRDAGVEIPFPQREVTVKGGPADAPQALLAGPAPAAAPVRVAPGATAGTRHDSVLDGPETGA